MVRLYITSAFPSSIMVSHVSSWLESELQGSVAASHVGMMLSALLLLNIYMRRHTSMVVSPPSASFPPSFVDSLRPRSSKYLVPLLSLSPCPPEQPDYRRYKQLPQYKHAQWYRLFSLVGSYSLQSAAAQTHFKLLLLFPPFFIYSATRIPAHSLAPIHCIINVSQPYSEP